MIDRPPNSADLRFEPLGMSNAGPALLVAARCFGWESVAISCTWAWHGLRGFVRSEAPMAFARCYDLEFAGEHSRITLVRTLIHGPRMCWASIAPGQSGAIAAWQARAAQCLGGSRRTFVRVQSGQRWEAGKSGFEFAGRFAGGAAAGGFDLYRSPESVSGDIAFAAPRARKAASLELDTSFDVARRGKRVVGFTGLYTTAFWPGIAWGGWGGLLRSDAGRGAAFELLRQTERLAAARKAAWLLIETSDAPAYRSARRMYELYGLEEQLRVPDFFGATDGGEAYMIYGKQLGGGPDVH